jgi:hypothetical protein
VTSIRASIVTGRATSQDNIVLRYLQNARARAPNAEAGFCAVLSDFFADCAEGFVPNSKTYAKGLRIRTPQGRTSKNNENLRTWKSIQRITGKDYGPMPPDFGTPDWAKKQSDARKKLRDAR